jgi:ankyrin repeat protein
MKMAFDVMIVPNRNTGRSAMHTSAFYGDVTFFQLILDHAQHNKDPDHNKESSSIIIPQHVLEMTCEDVGWAPLHYDTAIGSMELVELLLQGGANIHVLTDSILTCRDR